MAPGRLLQDKVALITGAGNGYGEGIAKLFGEEGAKVLVADINEQSGTRVASELNKQNHIAEFIHMNITKSEDWDKVLAFAKATFGGVDILVNNAGWTYRRKDTLSVSADEYDKIFDINVKSMFHATNTIMPHFFQKRSGNIVNIGSCITENPTTGLTWYGASKGAVDMITRHLAAEFSSRGIRVNGVSPSIGQTSLFQDFIAKEADEQAIASLTAPAPVGRLCTPLDVAKGALYFASDYFNDFQTGIILRVDGGHYVRVL